MHNERSLPTRAALSPGRPFHPHVYQHMSMHYRCVVYVLRYRREISWKFWNTSPPYALRVLLFTSSRCARDHRLLWCARNIVVINRSLRRDQLCRSKLALDHRPWLKWWWESDSACLSLLRYPILSWWSYNYRASEIRCLYFVIRFAFAHRLLFMSVLESLENALNHVDIGCKDSVYMLPHRTPEQIAREREPSTCWSVLTVSPAVSYLFRFL